MPELPEVERGRRIADRQVVGRTIARVHTVDDDIVYAGVTPRRFAAALKGRQVVAAHRRGKQQWFELDARPWPTFHFGMTGAFHAYESPKDRPKFCKVELTMDDGGRLAMTSKRRLGRLRLLHDPLTEPPISALGPDPLLEPPTTRGLGKLLGSRSALIKALLLDQALFAGVGNWIADEVLYQARVAPQRRAKTLSADETKRVRNALISVLRKACEVDADSDRFPRTWLFHHRWGKDADAVTARGEKVEHDTIGGRTTAWVPAVQR